jgi:mannose-6-phosphate isomerase-like protein (cupin superfamily)
LDLGEETFRLEKGDCFFMRFGLPIRFRNRLTRPIRYLVIVSRG